MSEGEQGRGWTEEDSRTFIDEGAIFVPAREEQIRTLCALVPGRPDDAFTVVELGAGAGVLAVAVLEAFLRCRYVALDGSPEMRRALTGRLASYGARVEVREFDLAGLGWRATLPRSLRCVFASLVVHHLPGPDKPKLFRSLWHSLETGGALLLADIIEPASPAAREVFARQWDDDVRARSLALTGNLDAFERFLAGGWNYYRGTPEPYDQPSRLDEQLQWLRQAGYVGVDCFWLRAGHAIYGGWKPGAGAG